MATSDLHMQMTAFDYVKDKPHAGGSLAKIATVVEIARQEMIKNGGICLLFDNGDTFQGTPVADVLTSVDAKPVHPMVCAMNTLKYDAVGLGNHDFDHGLDYLATGLARLQCPIICTNFEARLLPMVSPSVIIERDTIASDGSSVKVKIGVIASLPDKTALWSRHHLDARADFKQPVPVLDKAAKKLRTLGADVVVVLAHMGLATYDEGPEAQNLLSDVAALPYVDVVVGGHTHLRFPSSDHDGLNDIDMDVGTVHGTPLVQPGASATDLGVIDISLVATEQSPTWAIKNARSRLVPIEPDTPEDAIIKSHAAPAHEATRKFLSQPVGALLAPMHSYFALAHPSPIPALLAASKRETIQQAIAGTQYSDLPLIAVASAPLTGGFDGPDNFLHLAQGEIQRRHVAGMNPYANQVWAVKTNGARLLDWLERSAVIFNTLAPDAPDQMLINPSVPGFRFDAAYGLSYVIDPSCAPKFDVSGRANTKSTGRIRDITWQGEPLQPDMEFLVATTDHRAGGGGLYQMFQNSDIVIQGHAPLQDAVLTYLKSPNCKEVRDAKPWSFPPNLGCSAILLTAPEAVDHFADIAHLHPESCGENAQGFLRLRLHL
ncbi:MAG: 5'-nucleotidase C-terminal domain-containing protein [Roseobacter sp.]